MGGAKAPLRCYTKVLYKGRKQAAAGRTRLRKRIYDTTGTTQPIVIYRCRLGHHGLHLGHPFGWRIPTDEEPLNPLPEWTSQ